MKEIVIRCFEHTHLRPKEGAECGECERLKIIAEEMALDERTPCSYSGLLAFPIEQISAFGEKRIEARTQLPFRAKRLVWLETRYPSPDDLTMIRSVTIGTMLQLSVGFPEKMPARLFAVGGWPMENQCDTMMVGTSVFIDVVNGNDHLIAPLFVLLGDTIPRSYPK